MKRFLVEVYQTAEGDAPFEAWLDALKDGQAVSAILARIRRASLGNFGDWKPLKGTDGLHEMRIHHGPGFRIFYSIVGGTIVLVLAGSTKSDQTRVIARAETYLADYYKRIKH